jgi:hypothetical protein
MENDSIRASGNHTLVDIWINGKLRAISVSREAIDAYVGFDKATAMSDEDRCEFIRTHLPLVVSAAKARLHDASPGADSVLIDNGHLGSRGGDRRKAERRKADRRKTNRPKEALPQGERRHASRRKNQRRKPPAKPG